MDGGFRFVVQALDGAMADRHAEVVEDVWLVANQHPSMLTAPEMREELLQQIGRVDLEIDVVDLPRGSGAWCR